jgi:hypothetical protein
MWDTDVNITFKFILQATCREELELKQLTEDKNPVTVYFKCRIDTSRLYKADIRHQAVEYHLLILCYIPFTSMSVGDSLFRVCFKNNPLTCV